MHLLMPLAVSYDEASSRTNSSLTVNGAHAGPSISAGIGRIVYFAAGMEAHGAFSGPVGTFTFFNVTLTLAAPDPDFGKNPYIQPLDTKGSPPSSAGELKTADGGKTWTASTIELFKAVIAPEQQPAAPK